ncbi:protein EMSY-like protein [Dinothrombium tinctorium]|uniref:Protein EMSY-like protein n=1 Tax=Dinothrombium tinctorium TaxID=1965070 RepID=A0A3S3P5X3_9ACAR|nr:protein EMSY-like protein [Dinothrombium tinctorium]
MWPMLLEYSRDECRQMLRRLELEAYSSVVSALRAQGEFNKEKKQILQQLCHLLSITIERHQAEIRRAVNDEKLNTIAYCISKDNTHSEWAAEGRRLVPLMPRLVPQTAMTSISNVAANIQATKNESIMQSALAKSNQEATKETIVPCKRKRSDSGGNADFARNKIISSSNSSLSVSNSNKATKTLSVSKPSTSTHQTTTVSSSTPRVVFMTSSASGLRTLSSTSSTSSLNSIETLQIKTPLKAGSLPISALTTATSSQGTNVTATRVISAKAAFPQQVVVFPGNNNQKTITIPISQSLKLHSGTSSATFVYQQGSGNPATIKGISAKEVKIVSGETISKDDKMNNQINVKPATANVIGIQASGSVLQNIMKTGQLNKDFIDLVHKAVNNNGMQNECVESNKQAMEVEEQENEQLIENKCDEEKSVSMAVSI